MSFQLSVFYFILILFKCLLSFNKDIFIAQNTYFLLLPTLNKDVLYIQTIVQGKTSFGQK